MKTTVELPDDLLERCKAVARRENSTLQALIEEGLRLALSERTRARKRAAPFALQPFPGDGLSPEFAGAGWEKIRDARGDKGTPGRVNTDCLAPGAPPAPRP